MQISDQQNLIQISIVFRIKLILVTVRENTEDLYVGWEFNTDDKTAVAIRLITEKASLRIADYAFRLCRTRRKSNQVVAGT